MVRHLLETFPDTFELSISATTRAPRGEEVNGREYYFLTVEEFEKRVRENKFVEHEQVYEGLYYGFSEGNTTYISWYSNEPLFILYKTVPVLDLAPLISSKLLPV